LELPLRWNVKSMYFGELPGRANHVVLGMKPVYSLILRVLQPSFGMVTKIKRYFKLIRTLLSMNLEATLASVTYCGGLTDTQYVWKPKALVSYSPPAVFGSPAIYTQETGFRIWTKALWTLCFDDCRSPSSET